MALQRSSILKGAGWITFDGATILSEGEITADLIVETEGAPTDAYGDLADGIVDRRIEVTVTPKAWKDLAKLLPYASTMHGAGIYSTTDIPLVFATKHATLTVANARVTSMPNLNLRTRHGAANLGSMTFTGLVANNSDPALTASYYALSAGGATIPAIDLADLRREQFSATYNGTTIVADEGFQVSWNLNLSPQYDEQNGTYDMRFMGLVAEATCVPRGMTPSDLAGMLAYTGAMGSTAAAYDLVIAGSGSMAVTLKNCIARSGQVRGGADSHVTGAVQFRSVRTQATGALEALFTIA